MVRQSVITSAFESFRERPDLSTLFLTWTVIKLTMVVVWVGLFSGFIEA